MHRCQGKRDRRQSKSIERVARNASLGSGGAWEREMGISSNGEKNRVDHTLSR